MQGREVRFIHYNDEILPLFADEPWSKKCEERNNAPCECHRALIACKDASEENYAPIKAIMEAKGYKLKVLNK